MKTRGITAVVSGGASGLGEAVVREIAAEGGNAVILDLDVKKGRALAEQLGDGVIFHETDVTDDVAVKKAVEKARQVFGAIHVAVTCAGIATPGKVLGAKGPLPLELFNRVVQVNLIGTMNVITFAAEKMALNSPNEDGERGVIILTSSIVAFEGQIGQAAYSASKAGVAGLTLPLAREFADIGIRVVTISPGLFMTPMMDNLSEKAQAKLVDTVPFPRRMGRPREFALLVNHIIQNPMINGSTIRLDGAMRMPAI
jgi:3-hydroxyacyl-CoA dehydrogenase / 3-hydroxy-2-methylbutyryl-CoA dehydrogenase